MKTSQTTTANKTTIKDMRGAGYSANFITISENTPFYAGMKITESLLYPTPSINHLLTIKTESEQTIGLKILNG